MEHSKNTIKISVLGCKNIQLSKNQTAQTEYAYLRHVLSPLSIKPYKSETHNILFLL